MTFLEYVFMFETDAGWAHLDLFERDLAKFFESKNMEAEIVRTPGGYNGRRILLIKKKDMISPLVTPKKSLKNTKTPKEQFKAIKKLTM